MSIGYIDSGHVHCDPLPTAEQNAIAAFIKKLLLGDSSVSTDIWSPKCPLDAAKWVDWTAPDLKQ